MAIPKSVVLLALISKVLAQGSVALGALPREYTLTAYAPGNAVYDGLKVENLGLFHANVSQYCPSIVQNCPNGTDQAFFGTLTPDVEVPGGQDLYVQADGLIAITVQHSHYIPAGAYPNYEGWSWTALPLSQPAPANCDASNPIYNCDPPTGYFNFKAPNPATTYKAKRACGGGSTLPPVYQGGVKACTSPYNNQSVVLYAVTPGFNRTDCVDLAGLGTHNYTGPSPAVWAY